jgi:hypothetical protein
MLGDLGGALSVPLVRIGDRLGLYKALHTDGPMTAAELAAKTNVAERYARKWLSHQAASGYLAYDSTTGKFTLPPEQAIVLAEPDSPVLPARRFAVTMMENQALLEPARQRGRLGRAVAVPVLRRGTLFSSGLSQQPRRILAAGVGRRHREAQAARECLK